MCYVVICIHNCSLTKKKIYISFNLNTWIFDSCSLDWVNDLKNSLTINSIHVISKLLRCHQKPFCCLVLRCNKSPKIYCHSHDSAWHANNCKQIINHTSLSSDCFPFYICMAWVEQNYFYVFPFSHVFMSVHFRQAPIFSLMIIGNRIGTRS